MLYLLVLLLFWLWCQSCPPLFLLLLSSRVRCRVPACRAPSMPCFSLLSPCLPAMCVSACGNEAALHWPTCRPSLHPPPIPFSSLSPHPPTMSLLSCSCIHPSTYPMHETASPPTLPACVWTQLKLPGSPPAPRCGHSATASRTQVSMAHPPPSLPASPSPGPPPICRPRLLQSPLALHSMRGRKARHQAPNRMA